MTGHDVQEECRANATRTQSTAMPLALIVTVHLAMSSLRKRAR